MPVGHNALSASSVAWCRHLTGILNPTLDQCNIRVREQDKGVECVAIIGKCVFYNFEVQVVRL